jgi:MFS transporter, CP family, cyanate transporter
MSAILGRVPSDRRVKENRTDTETTTLARLVTEAERRQNDGAVELLPRDRSAALAPTALLVAAVLLVAANLRPAVTSFGSVLDDVRSSLHASATWASVLTAMPGLCFGFAGFLAPVLARHFGLARAIGASLVLLAAGVFGRVVDGPSVVLTGTLVACAGIAVCNVLLPVVVKESFPHRIGLVTGLYTAVLQGTAALGALITPQVDTALGGWRPALGEWGLLALLGVLGWAVAARHGRAPGAPRPTDAPTPAEPRRRLTRSGLAWIVTGFFGLQSMFAYAIMGSQSAWLVGLTSVGAIGLVGLAVAPGAAPWVWSLCLGIGMGVFALAVALISLRSSTAADTRALSTMTQGTGYLLAAAGPLVFGVLHGATGGWTASLLVLAVGLVVQAVLGALAGRPRTV